MKIKTLTTIGAVAVFSFTALADDGHDDNNNNKNQNGSFQSSVIGSASGMAIGGVASGGAPWVVTQGSASVSSNGSIHVELQGLLIAAGGPAGLVGTTASVTMVGATLVCGGSGGTPAAVTGAGVTASPLSSSGNAVIDQSVTLPPACFGPVVLVQIFNVSAPSGSQLGPFIAATGLTPSTADHQNQNHDDHGDGGSGH